MKDLSWIFSLETIAVVGASTEKQKPAHYVPLYLKEHGYTIIPINPHASEIFGEPCYPSLKEIDTADIVEMFRPSTEIMDFMPDILDVSPQVLWMQLGIKNEEAKKIAEANNIHTVMDKCMMQEHKKLFGD
ncbi:MAG: CoA-binding protein [Candidatus Methanofastidiosia archaeon]|jgi:predicted CoA-binding protein